VHSHRPDVDPVGACLGPKSTRIANVSDELRGEKIDVIRWSPDPVVFISNALAPAKVLGVELFEDEGVALVTVPDYQLSLAIGREGQNVRLAARLTGWRLDITSEAEAEEARQRYLAEREERASTVTVPAPVAEPETVIAEEPVSEEAEEGEAAPVSIDPDLLRKLEEFKRERLGQESGGGE
jgi:N utilization substance protein A